MRQLENIPAHRAVDRKRLEGQLYYRLERYDDCIRVYGELFDAPYHEDSIEAKANVVAAYVAAGRSGEIPSALRDVLKGDAEESLEVSFNVACGLVASGRLEEAREQLAKTQRIGEETLFDEGLEDDEVAEELAGVEAQVAYVDAAVGDAEVAAAGNDRVLGLEGPDEIANVVAAANGVLLQVARDPRDRKGAQERLKKLDPFLERSGGLLRVSSVLGGRLGKRTCVRVLAAYACGSLAANKADHAREAVRSLETMYPGEALGSLLVASISAKEGKTKEAIVCLEKAMAGSEGPEGSEGSPEGLGLAAAALRAQLAAHAKSYVEAADALGDARLPSSIKSQPAVVATRTALYELGGDLSRAEQTVLAALHETTVNGETAANTKSWALKKLAKINLASGDLTAATDYLVQLARADAAAWEDAEVLKLLPRCVACCDPSKLEDIDVRIGGGGSEFECIEVDVDVLEAQAGSMLASASQGAGNKRAGDSEAGDSEKRSKKKKKKHKPIYPKGFDPEHPERTPQPDPERWLPKWQRSENKKLRKKMAKAGHVTGSQGAGKIDTSLDYSTRESNKPAAMQQPQGKGKKKGKKGGRR